MFFGLREGWQGRIHQTDSSFTMVVESSPPPFRLMAFWISQPLILINGSFHGVLWGSCLGTYSIHGMIVQSNGWKLAGAQLGQKPFIQVIVILLMNKKKII